MRAFTTLTLTLITALAVLAPPASADTPGCATREEFRRVERGMSSVRVAKILDTNGSRGAVVDGPGYHETYRLYTKCGSLPALASVDYRRNDGSTVWRVTSKGW